MTIIYILIAYIVGMMTPFVGLWMSAWAQKLEEENKIIIPPPLNEIKYPQAVQFVEPTRENENVDINKLNV